MGRIPRPLRPLRPLRPPCPPTPSPIRWYVSGPARLTAGLVTMNRRIIPAGNRIDRGSMNCGPGNAKPLKTRKGVGPAEISSRRERRNPGRGVSPGIDVKRYCPRGANDPLGMKAVGYPAHRSPTGGRRTRPTHNNQPDPLLRCLGRSYLESLPTLPPPAPHSSRTNFLIPP